MAKHFSHMDGGDAAAKPVTEIPVIEHAVSEDEDEPNLELEALNSSYDTDNLRRVRKMCLVKSQFRECARISFGSVHETFAGLRTDPPTLTATS